MIRGDKWSKSWSHQSTPGHFFNPFLSLIVLWSYKLSQNPISVNCLITHWQLPCSKWQLHKSNFMVFYHPLMDKCLSGPVYVLPVVNNFCKAALPSPHPPTHETDMLSCALSFTSLFLTSWISDTPVFSEFSTCQPLVLNTSDQMLDTWIPLTTGSHQNRVPLSIVLPFFHYSSYHCLK